MATKKKMLQAAAGNAGGAGPDVEDVFSTYLYEGNMSTVGGGDGSSQTIVNGIDLAGEGGLVWRKDRTAATYANHTLVDTERGVRQTMFSTQTTQQLDRASVTSFNSDGFTIGDYLNGNQINNDYVSWTFRKAPKFFDVVTYTGTGSAQTIAHNLGDTPGTIIIKGTDYVENWIVYHRSLGATKYIQLNTTGAASTSSAAWNNTEPTSTEFTVNSFNAVNESGYSYVAYLFAHNDGDGEFGPDGDADIIKCGSYTGTGSAGNEIDLGFEPQWVIIKGVDATGAYNWYMYDAMRGVSSGGNDNYLFADTKGAEDTTADLIEFTSTGFTLVGGASGVNDGSSDYIYIAIRRGTKVPESGTEVFNTTVGTTSGDVGFPVDWVAGTLNRTSLQSYEPFVHDRMRGNAPYLTTSSTADEATGSGIGLDSSEGLTFDFSSYSNAVLWNLKRAPNFFDVVAYTGTGSSQAVGHNLGVAPEMVWVKHRSSAPFGNENWTVGVPTTNNPANGLFLNTTDAFRSGNDDIEAVSASTFTVGSHPRSNWSGVDYIAYLFASLDGVSKVGSYTADGNVQNIDCGFTSGARFVLIKRTDSIGNWYVFDTERGIVAGNDPWLELNTSSAEDSQYDNIDPYSAGFTLTAYGGTSPALNIPSAEYIFYAIA